MTEEVLAPALHQQVRRETTKLSTAHLHSEESSSEISSSGPPVRIN